MQCVSSCHSIGNCVGIFFLLWSWQLHCVLFHGIFFRPWHWQLCLMLCCSIFLCAFVKQCAMAFFSMLQHCSIACYTAALALHLMQGAIVVIPHCSQWFLPWCHCCMMQWCNWLGCIFVGLFLQQGNRHHHKNGNQTGIVWKLWQLVSGSWWQLVFRRWWHLEAGGGRNATTTMAGLTVLMIFCTQKHAGYHMLPLPGWFYFLFLHQSNRCHC